MPDPRAGQKGGEDSFNVLPAFHGDPLKGRPPLFFNDHKESKEDPAVAAMRLDSPTVQGEVFEGQWKVFFDASLLRAGEAKAFELYDLEEDRWETENLVDRSELAPLVKHLSAIALKHRTAGGHRLAAFAGQERSDLDFRSLFGARAKNAGQAALKHKILNGAVEMKMQTGGKDQRFNTGAQGLGVGEGQSPFDSGESVRFSFDRDVIVESVAVVAGEGGTCGGFYTVGDGAPLAIYCTDADIDAKDQSGILSDIGVVKAGESLTLTTEPHFGSEAPGVWRIQSITVRAIN